MLKLVRILRAGRLSYSKGLKLQQKLIDLHHHGSANTLILIEHPPVYTIGIRSKDYPEDVAQKLRELGADFCRTDRGGLITFHGPGQLVVYPILNLRDFNPSIRWYVGNIERTVIRLCQKFGLEGETSPHTGVWIKNNKICAVGLRVSRYITSHGLSVNCNTDLEWFNHIVPCGIVGKGVTSLTQELGRHIQIEDVIPVFLDCFSEVFNCNLADLPQDETDKLIND